MRRLLVPSALVLLLVGTYWQMWFGPGGVPRVTELEQELAEAEAQNTKVRQEIEQLKSEIDDLQAGLGAVEEKARMDLGMVKPDEIFVQIATDDP